MNIGIYVRPWNEKFYYNLASEIFETSYKKVSLSEFKNIGDIWLGAGLYKESSSETIFNLDEKIEIYTRCRFLRSLEVNRAFDLINKMSNQIVNLFEKYKFKFILGQMIDNYTLDILERVCQMKNIEYISISGHFFNGYSRVTKRGEYNVIRKDITEYEISAILNKILEKEYKPNFELNKEKSYKDGVKYFLRDLVKKKYFNIKRLLDRDYLNYHYNSFEIPKTNMRNIVSKDLNRYFCKIKDINIDEKSVYVPLHYTPEATVDYWSDNYKHGLYKESLIDLIQKSSPEINFIFKEHPAMYMKNEISFYKQILSFSNVRLIHPYENSNEILEKVDNVLVYTGSVGVEALLRNKRVLAITRNYYSELHPNIKVVKSVNLETLRETIVEYDNKIFIKILLEGLFPAEFINNRNINKSDTKNIAKYLKKYITNSSVRKCEI